MVSLTATRNTTSGWALTPSALFHGLPTWAELLLFIVFLLIVLVFAWTAVLFVLSRRALRQAPAPSSESADGFLWVFLVPALDEAVTIADSVWRLVAVEARNKLIYVIDDGSTDETAAVLATIDIPELQVVRRMLPDARRGKAAALNAAWQRLDEVLSVRRWAGWPRDRVIVCVIDADGRLDAAHRRWLLLISRLIASAWAAGARSHLQPLTVPAIRQRNRRC